MVLKKEQIAVIKNDCQEIGWNANKVCKKHGTFNCSRKAVSDLVQNVKETGSGEIQKESGQSLSATI